MVNKPCTINAFLLEPNPIIINPYRYSLNSPSLKYDFTGLAPDDAAMDTAWEYCWRTWLQPAIGACESPYFAQLTDWVNCNNLINAQVASFSITNCIIKGILLAIAGCALKCLPSLFFGPAAYAGCIAACLPLSIAAAIASCYIAYGIFLLGASICRDLNKCRLNRALYKKQKCRQEAFIKFCECLIASTYWQDCDEDDYWDLFVIQEKSIEERPYKDDPNPNHRPRLAIQQEYTPCCSTKEQFIPNVSCQRWASWCPCNWEPY
ncbi:MAG: hypothetical protein NTY09_01120 [bacterium]|nr:hypothetical protein [bacterium]